MTIKAKFNIANVRDYILKQTTRADTAVLNAYRFAGETFVRDARIKTKAEGGFGDITGNLRSSIGYIIIKNGEQLDLNFQPADSGTDKATGIAKGITFAEQIAERYPKGLALICVAGMEYAAAVESKGYDVITGSTLDLETKLKGLLRQL